MIINRHSLLDGSIGKRWSSYRKGFNWILPSYFAEYDFRDERGRQSIKAYDYSELQYFVKWLDNIYRLKILPSYIAEQMHKGSLIKA